MMSGFGDEHEEPMTPGDELPMDRHFRHRARIGGGRIGR